MLIRKGEQLWGVTLFLDTLLFIFCHDSLINSSAWTVMCKRSPMLTPSQFGVKGTVAAFHPAATRSHHCTTSHSLTACLIWHDVFTGRFLHYKKYLAVGLTLARLICLHEPFDNLWLSLLVAMNESCTYSSSPGKMCKKDTRSRYCVQYTGTKALLISIGTVNNAGHYLFHMSLLLHLQDIGVCLC